MEPDFPTTTRCSHPKVPVKTYKIYINVYFWNNHIQVVHEPFYPQ